MSYQKISVCGIIGKTAEVKTFNNKSFLSFSVAVQNGKDAQGNTKPSTWYEVTKDFNPQTQGWLAQRLVAKSMVLVEGKPSINVYLGKDGQPHGEIKIFASVVDPIGIVQKVEDNAPQSVMTAPAAATSAPAMAQGNNAANHPTPNGADDIPF